MPPAKLKSKSPLEYTWSYWTLQCAQGIYRRLFDSGFAEDVVPTKSLDDPLNLAIMPICKTHRS